MEDLEEKIGRYILNIKVQKNNIEELNKNKDIVINDFKEYLEENYTEFYNNLDNFRFCKDSRSFGIELLAEQYINNYIISLYYDIQDNTDNYAEHLNVENEIFEILKNYFENT